MDTSVAGRARGRLRSAVLIGGLGVFVASAAGLVLTGHGAVRYSADHAGTRPLWTIWVPALVGIALVRLVPPRLATDVPPAVTDRRRLTVETWFCVAAALLFALALPLATGPASDLRFVGLKLVLLLGVPLAVFAVRRGRWPEPPGPRDRWRWLGPAPAVAAWFALAYVGPMASRGPSPSVHDPATMAVLLLAGFLLNAVLEEVFYRVWLQSRLEAQLGRWVGIVLASLLWAVWHVAIQPAGEVWVSLASVISNQGVTGLFLGYLWSRYRNVWALILVHGAINAPLSLLAEFGG